MSKHTVKSYPLNVPLIAYFVCKCGKRFLTQKDLRKHTNRKESRDESANDKLCRLQVLAETLLRRAS